MEGDDLALSDFVGGESASPPQPVAKAEAKVEGLDRRQSLASLRPWSTSVIMTSLILLSHGLMLWGQIAPLWDLSYQFGGDVTVSPNSLANKLNFTEPFDFSFGGEKVQLHVFTYWGSITGLWKIGRPVSRLTAVLLFWFSCLAPHGKLIILHIYYYFKVRKSSRRNAFYWISSLGKISLIDVCMTCLLFALMNINIVVPFGGETSYDILPDVETIKTTFVNVTNLSEASQNVLNSYSFPEKPGQLNSLADTLLANNDTRLWDPLLAQACGDAHATTCPVGSYPDSDAFTVRGYSPPQCNTTSEACELCPCFMQNVLYQPSLKRATQDEVKSLYFAKMLTLPLQPPAREPFVNVSGVLYFKCILGSYIAFLGFALNIFASIAASVWANQAEDEQTAKEKGTDVWSTLRARKAAGLPLLQNESVWLKVAVVALPCFTIPALCVPIYRYIISGLLPQLTSLNPDGIVSDLSVISLTALVAEENNSFLNFFAFIIGFISIGLPLLRVALLGLLGFAPLPPLVQYLMAKFANEVGSLTAWEPLTLAVIFLRVQMPAVTGTTITIDICDNFKANPFVKVLIEILHPTDTYDCFWISFGHLGTVALLIIAWFLIVYVNKFMWEKMVRVLEPFGEKVPPQGPGCCLCCYDFECS
eukprot:gb/GEZN01003795.1/.p1 GENE.gb/GEZN01003795.1/~~gb/GEZN01003795.1/.p1  ORF type:complete len:647 (+),score=59.13 gb/GEZN01003795.1/:42-1982(+)